MPAWQAVAKVTSCNSVVELSLHDALGFDLADQGLQCVDNARADISAHQDIHDIVSNRELSFIQPGVYIHAYDPCTAARQMVYYSKHFGKG